MFVSLCKRFSKRRGEIERQIEKFEEKQDGKPTVKEIALITRETRPAELKKIATAEVLALQRSQLSPEEWTQLQALRARSERQTLPIQTGQERDALRASVGHLFERQSVLREHEILAEALNQSLGSLDLEELNKPPRMTRPDWCAFPLMPKTRCSRNAARGRAWSWKSGL